MSDNNRAGCVISVISVVSMIVGLIAGATFGAIYAASKLKELYQPE